MKRKPKKSKEEKLSENFFPVDERDVQYAIEKKQKGGQEEILEIIHKKPKRKTLNSKKTTRKTTKKSSKKSPADFEPKTFNLKKEGYELIITEKPQAALKISSALGKSSKKLVNGVPYYEVTRGKKKLVVACAVGHLFTLTQTEKGSHVPIFDIKWVPNYFVRKSDFTKKYYDVLSRLAKSAGSLTVATDYDIEGEVIGLNVVRFLCGQKDAERMKFSTLTQKELDQAYESKSKSINWGQAIAGETRHFLDWFYGINLSRALMNSIKEAGRFKLMSIGRVQGPALNLIVQREKKIADFKSKKYWQVFITIDSSPKVELKYTKDIFNKSELDIFKKLKGESVDVVTVSKETKLSPNPPFNLTTLQTEAYRLYGFTPSRTLQIAQSLYLAGMISYPRTSSQKLPDPIGYKEILKKFADRFKVKKLMTRDKPVEGKKSDPAHPSIYPTGNDETSMNQDEEKIYNLIIKRFLSLFCEDAIVSNKTITAKKDKLVFKTKGASVVKKSWLEIYPYKIKEKTVPDINGENKIIDVKTEEKETQPPKRYSPASILSELEKRNLGTKATRAAILETLYNRGYVKDKSIEATPLGISLISSLEKYSPIIIDEKLTRKFEKGMESIVQSKKNFEEKEKKLIEDAKETIMEISKDFEKNKKEIGNELLTGELELREKEKQENKLVQCPVCKKGFLAITYSRKNRKHFVACDAYPECKTTFSLPPNSVIKKTEKVCEHCGFPILMALRKGKRPWFFCFNKECESNKKRLEEYYKRKQEQNPEEK